LKNYAYYLFSELHLTRKEQGQKQQQKRKFREADEDFENANKTANSSEAQDKVISEQRREELKECNDAQSVRLSSLKEGEFTNTRQSCRTVHCATTPCIILWPNNA